MTKFLSTKELGKLTNSSDSTVARRLRDGTIPFSRLGRKILIPVSYLENLEASATATKTAECQ